MNKLRFKFILGRRSNRPNHLTLEVSKPQVRVFVETGVVVSSPNQWDAERQRLNGKYPNAEQANRMLHSLVARIEHAEYAAMELGLPFGRDEITKALAQVSGDSEDLLTLFRHYNERDYECGTVKRDSYVKYKSNLNTLERFMSEKCGGPIKLHLFTFDVVQSLDIWLMDIYNPASAAKFHRSIKKFVTRAIDEGKARQNAYDRFKPRKARTPERQSLSSQELKRIESLRRDDLLEVDRRMVEVVDRFLFSCYTGLRISDNSSLRKDQIRVEPEGLVVDMVTQKMGGARVQIPLRLIFGGKAEAIAKKYLEMDNGCPTLFPPMPDQKINVRLKSLAVMAGVKFNLTFHIARHTCATMLAEKTGNPYLIKEILGHEDIKTSMVYIHNSYMSTVRSLMHVDWSDMSEVVKFRMREERLCENDGKEKSALKLEDMGLSDLLP